MGVEKLLEKAKTRFSMSDVEKGEVEAVTVIAVDELSQLIDRHLEEQIATLKSKLSEAENRLASSDSDDGGLERAAAEAAMEAEAAALERAAAAELRAEQAEAKLAKLEGDDSEDLKAELDSLKAEVKSLKDKNAELQKQADEAAASGDDDEKVTDEDHSRAARLAVALIEDVVADDETKAKKSIEAGTFRDDFAEALKASKSRYNRRTSAAVRGERDHWDEAISALK